MSRATVRVVRHVLRFARRILLRAAGSRRNRRDRRQGPATSYTSCSRCCSGSWWLYRFSVSSPRGAEAARASRPLPFFALNLAASAWSASVVFVWLATSIFLPCRFSGPHVRTMASEEAKRLRLYRCGRHGWSARPSLFNARGDRRVSAGSDARTRPGQHRRLGCRCASPEN